LKFSAFVFCFFCSLFFGTGTAGAAIVKWKSSVKVNAPIVESIMIGTKTQQGISFISRGRVIQE